MTEMLRDRLPARVRVVEVGARDGLQNEPDPIPTEAKVAFIEALAAAGLDTVEPTAFVHPKRVPQLADAAEVMAALTRQDGVRYPVLVPNAKGLERALQSGVREIAIFSAASDGFNEANIGMTVDASLAGYDALMERAKAEGLWIRGYVSTCFGCPFDGAVAPDRVAEVTSRLLAMGCDELSLGDTIGVAHPLQVEAVVAALVGARVPIEKVAFHFHDTRGTALVNVLAALPLGVGIFDASAGGLGGCPFAPGATGNLATEDLLYLLDGMGIETGVDREAVERATAGIAEALGRQPPGRVYNASRSATRAPVRWPVRSDEA